LGFFKLFQVLRYYFWSFLCSRCVSSLRLHLILPFWLLDPRWVKN
jgi:hypothetical protein